MTASSSYSYQVRAVDAAGNTGDFSNTTTVTTPAPPPIGPGPIRVGPTGRYLVDQNNVPWLMVGDSPQAMINLSEADMATYMADRQAQGFNTIWVNLLCTSYTYCNTDGTTYDGIAPFTAHLAGGNDVAHYNLATPNPAYFARVDDMINLAAQNGLEVVLDPIETSASCLASTTACWEATLDNNGAAADLAYGQYLGNRYKNFDNIIWMSGNDFQSWSDARRGRSSCQVMRGESRTRHDPRPSTRSETRH